MEFDTDYAIQDFLDNLPVGQVFTDDVGLRYTVIEQGAFQSDGGVIFPSRLFDAYDVIDLEVSAE